MSNTKILVLHLREIIYTAIFIALSIVLILLLIVMFTGRDNSVQESDPASATYTAGIYTTPLTLNGQALNLELVLDTNHINSVRFVSLDESITTMYPLVESTLASISEQLAQGIDLQEITYEGSNQYTHEFLIHSIETALEKATNTTP